MEYWIEKVRIGLQSIILFLFALVTPLRASLEVLIMVSALDFFAGMAGNVWTGRERFRIGKAFASLYKLIAYLILIIVSHYAAANLGEREMAWILVKYVTLMVSYWYFVNILSNLKLAFPSSTGITFLYLILSLKMLPIILSKIGIGGEDIQELSKMARTQTGVGEPIEHKDIGICDQKDNPVSESQKCNQKEE